MDENWFRRTSRVECQNRFLFRQVTIVVVTWASKWAFFLWKSIRNILTSFTNLTRALGMFTFEGRHTCSFAASIIIAIQNTLAESFACLIQTSIQVIIIWVVLKYELITIISVSDLHCRSKLGCRILGSHWCNQYNMDKLNKRNHPNEIFHWKEEKKWTYSHRR